jgi:hypothetical protein
MGPYVKQPSSQPFLSGIYKIRLVQQVMGKQRITLDWELGMQILQV